MNVTQVYPIYDAAICTLLCARKDGKISYDVFYSLITYESAEGIKRTVSISQYT